MRTTCFGLLIFLLCAACSEQHDHKGRTPLVELDGNFLYREDLQSVLPAGLSKDDSLLFAEHYIRNWVEDILLYDKAQSNIPNNGEIDKLVENYRKALIMHMWMNWCSKGRMQPWFCHFPLLLYKVASRRDQIVGKRCESRS